ncbi:response regulator transcription factor [Paenibacillus doosanensis]|uniref:Oxygen regulatory protein NreC n=1 Tax=Paenibacillus konkukensis TaxID=2020716 RepID=A0ABY4RNE7_9BACL|nr:MULTISPECIES: response regulator transcription factor [Paenibacillus]MCS7461698.1 response regulator transcription factor [Paenibacillus doosanensis]UQZ83540.1 Oxygen regulatory protein NreC [Paenibacillus konkukensis]
MTTPIRVIVAEDLDVLRDHFCELISRERDMEIVAQASSGKQVLQLLQEKQADIIVMDIEMDMKHDGIITAQKVLLQYPYMKIVFLTVHEDDETVFNAFETGAVDYVLKTSSPEEIISSIRNAYDGIVLIRPEFSYKIKNEFSRIRRNEESLLKATIILSQMTPTELEILELLLKDMKVAEIAKYRQVELSTIKSQINMILKKFNKKRSKEVTAMLRDLNVQQLIHKVRGGS